jgi:hypothetical protein
MENLPSLTELEERTRTQTNESEVETLSAIIKLLNQYLTGFQQIGEFNKTDTNQAEQVWLYLTVRAFNSLRQAYSLMESGYYSQSIMLIRATFEDWLVCEDVKAHPDTVGAILSNNRPMPTISTMINRLDECLKQRLGDMLGDNGLYGILSTFTHPRYRAAAVLVDPDSNLIRLGPSYDEDLFLFVSNYLMSALIRMTEFLARLVGATNEEWLNTTNPIINQALECRELIVQRAISRLEGRPQN